VHTVFIVDGTGEGVLVGLLHLKDASNLTGLGNLDIKLQYPLKEEKKEDVSLLL
jgi:hypothetical protein